MKRPAFAVDKAGRPLNKKRTLCACGVDDCCILPCRFEARSWTISTPGAETDLNFAKLSCLSNFGRNIDVCSPEQRGIIVDALKEYATGSGNGEVTRLQPHWEKLPHIGSNVATTDENGAVEPSLETKWDVEVLALSCRVPSDLFLDFL